jgi:2-polyprenyl-3-methyl-5-hydroxy-6-metoxy-1,4-benzoquinol methylase
MNNAMIQSKGQSSNFLHAKALSLIADQYKKNKILDVGCGTGEFLEKLKREGFENITGCDGMNYGISPSIRFLEVNLNVKWGFENESFDFISSLEVVEHLENPRFFFRELFRVLRKEGEILISTPNNECFTSILSLLGKGHFSAFVDNCYPAHITPIISIDAVRMAKEAGFQSVELHWSGRGRIPGTGIHWQNILGSLANGKRTSDNFYLRAKK